MGVQGPRNPGCGYRGAVVMGPRDGRFGVQGVWCGC